MKESQVVVCHTPLRAKVAEFRSKRVLIIGRPDCVAVARSYGFSRAVGPGRIHAEHPHIYPLQKPSDDEIRQALLSKEPIGEHPPNLPTSLFGCRRASCSSVFQGRMLRAPEGTRLFRNTPAASGFFLETLRRPEKQASSTYSRCFY